MKWIVAVILLALLAMLFDLSMWVYALYAIGAIFFISRWVTSRWVDAVSAERICDSKTVRIGDVVTVIIRLKHTGRWPITWLLLEDLIEPRALAFQPPALSVSGRRLEVIKMRPGEQKQILYQLKCNRRGYFQIGPLVIETGDMFGLNRRFRVLTDPVYVQVLPAAIPIPAYDIASRRPVGEVVMTHRLFEDPTRISGVRRYQMGDPLSRVHWRATARTGKLQCKTYEPSTLAGATIVVDFRKDSFDRKHEPVRSELAITAAASVANALHGLGQQVGLVSNGRDAVDRIRQEGWRGDRRTRSEAQKSVRMMSKSEQLQPVVVPTRKSTDQMFHILQALARLELTQGLTLSELLQESAARIPRDATVIVIVSSITLGNAVALGGLKKQGYSVEVIVNSYSEDQFVVVSGALLAEGIYARHLKDESSVPWICEKQVTR